MPPPKIYSYEEYLNLMADSSGLKMQEESDLIVERFRSIQNIASRFAPVTFLLDLTTKKYYHVQPSCLNLFGYPASWFIESGLEGFLATWHPLDYNIINKKVFPDNIKFLMTLAKEKYPDIVFSYNYRVLNPKGEYVSTLQRFSYIPGEKVGFPIGIIGVAFDITHFKNDLSIVHTIEETVAYNGNIINELLFKKVHPVPDQQLMSNRELEILKYLAAGFSSKQIGDRINISINTVNNHRKRMLSKTKCNTSAELMTYAIKHGLL